MTTLFPPILENQRESIWFYSDPVGRYFELRFQMPQVNTSATDIRHIQISAKYRSTNRPALNPAYTPDNATLFFALNPNGGIPADIPGKWSYDEKNRICSIFFGYEYFEGGMPKNGCEYTFQIRFGTTRLWDSGKNDVIGFHTGNFDGFSQWFNRGATAVPSAFGEWSNVQRIFCIAPPKADIKITTEGRFCPLVSWSYSPSTGDNGEVYDAVQQIILQWDWESRDELGNKVRQYRTTTFNGTFNDAGEFSFTQEIPIAPVVPIHVSITAVTQHNTVITSNENFIPFDDKGVMTAFVMADMSGVTFSNFELKDAQTDDGCIAKSVTIEKGLYHGFTLQMYRYDLKTYDCVMIKSLEIASRKVVNGVIGNPVTAIYTFKDYTVAMGDCYQYIPVIVSDNAKSRLCASLTEVGEGTIGYARLMNMEMTFLNDRYHQLRIPGNLSVSGFKRNTSDQFQNTLGGEFPYYIRNGKQNYRSLSVSAVISVNFDPTFTFLRLDEDLGLLWEDKDARKLLVDKKDLFGVEDFSNSRWRVGYPSGRVNEEPKIIALGDDAMDEWALLDAQLEWLITKKDNNNKTVMDKIRAALELRLGTDRSTWPTWVPLTLGSVIDFCSENQTGQKNQIKAVLSPILTADIKTLWAKMNQYYSGRQVTSQQYLADYNGKSVYSPDYIRNHTTTIGTDHTDEMVYIERKFRDAVMSWLSDGKPKLYRSETEGNMIVVVTQPTFTPLNKTQRMVYSVSMTLTEIAEYNLENLIEYNLIPSQIISEYIPRGEWGLSFGNPDPWVGTHIGLVYDPKYDVPSTKIEKDDKGNDITKFTPINLNDAVINLYPGYNSEIIWFAEGLPDCLSLDCKTGIITLNRGKIAPFRHTTAKIIIYDRWPAITATDVAYAAQWNNPVKSTGFETWWEGHMKSRHDRAEMIINIGDFYDSFLIGWAYTETGDLDRDDIEIRADAVGDIVTPIYFRVLDSAPGVAPYSWSIAGESIPAGLYLEPMGEHNYMCKLYGTFLQEELSASNFRVVCTDDKFQIASIKVNYGLVHNPILLVEKEETSVLADLEQFEAVPAFDYKEQTRYGTDPENKTGYVFELRVYEDDSKTTTKKAGANDYNHGIGIDANGKLTGSFNGAVSFPYTSRLPLVIRVYDTGDPYTLIPGIPQPSNVGSYNGTLYRMSEIEVDLIDVWQKFEFIKPKDIDPGKRAPYAFTIGGVLEPYDIMSKFVKDDGSPDTGADAQHPVRGGKPRAKNPRPYAFYLRAPASGDTLPNFSITSAGRFSGVMTQTAPAGFLEIVAVDGRGHERSIQVEIPEVVGKFKIKPNPADKLVIGRTYVGNDEDTNKEWFRIWSKQPDMQDSLIDDLVGEEGEFSDFVIKVEGLPLGIEIIKDTTEKCFIFKGNPVANASADGGDGPLDLDEWKALNAKMANTFKDLRSDNYRTNATVRKRVNDDLLAEKMTIGAGTHFATVTILDGFRQYNTNGTLKPIEQTRRAASHTILIEGVYPPFIWNGKVEVPATDADVCAQITPIELPRISGGTAPFHWTEESIKAIEPYTLLPVTNSGEEAGGFDGGERLYISGSPSGSQPAKNVTLTLVDATGQTQSIEVSVGQIRGTVGVVAAERWGEPFVKGISNASNGDIKIVFPLDLNNGGSYRVIYKPDGENATTTLPNGMTIDATGKISGTATKTAPATNIGALCTIEITNSDNSKQTLPCPNWWMPATVDPPTSAFNGTYEIKGLRQNKSFTSDPLFILDPAGNALPMTYKKDGDALPAQLGFNLATLRIAGTAGVSTDSDLTMTFELSFGGKNDVTPLTKVSQKVVIKPITTIFTLGTPDSGFSIPGLTKNKKLGTTGTSPEIELTGDFANGKTILHGGTSPITWHVEWDKPCGLSISFDKNDNTKGRKLMLVGTPNITSTEPIKFRVWAEDAEGQLTQKIEFTIPGIWDELKVKDPSSGKISIPAKTAGDELTKMTITAQGGSGDDKNYRWIDKTSIIASYGYKIEKKDITLEIGGNASSKNMEAYTQTDRFITLQDIKSKQEVQVPISIGAITGGTINLKSLEYKIANAARGASVSFNLTSQLIGTTAEKNATTFEVDDYSPIPSDWEKSGGYGIEVVKSGSNWVLTGKNPNKAIDKELAFRIKAIYNGENIGYITVRLPAIT